MFTCSENCLWTQKKASTWLKYPKSFKISSKIAPHNFLDPFSAVPKNRPCQVKLCIGLLNINHTWIFWYRRHNNFMKNSPKNISKRPQKYLFLKILFHFSTFNKFLIFLSKISHCRYPETFNFCQFVSSVENKIQWREQFFIHPPRVESSWFYLRKYESKHNSHRTNGLIAFLSSINSIFLPHLLTFQLVFDLCRQTRELFQLVLCKYLWIISCDDKFPLMMPPHGKWPQFTKFSKLNHQILGATNAKRRERKLKIDLESKNQQSKIKSRIWCILKLWMMWGN